MSRPRVVCLVGPTAAGKTALALALAEQLGGEIVSADSRLVYRRLDIGTAKPTRAEQQRVRHHCLDLVEPTESFDVARYRAAAAAAIADVTARGRVPLVVGGTGLWVRALLRGLCPAPPRVPALRAELDAVAARDGSGALHARLSTLDPVSAARLHPHDRVRIVRAIEVAIASGQPLSAWQTAHRFSEAPFDVFCAGLATEPGVLADRIAARVDDMLARGWLGEVAALVADGLTDDAPAWQTLGYRELRSVTRGDLTLAEATVVIRRATLRFAARQRTWFRREPDMHWYVGDDDPTPLRDAITTFLAGPAQAS